MLRTTLIGLACVLPSLAGCAQGTSDAADPCEEARRLVRSCTGETVPEPPEGCVEPYRSESESLLAAGCRALDTSGDKSSAGGLWCRPQRRWLGLCRDVPLSEAAAVTALADVCPAHRVDPLCLEMREAHAASGSASSTSSSPWRRARAAATDLATRDRDDAVRDPAVQYFVRTRMLELFYAYEQCGGIFPCDDGRMDALIERHYPAYAAENRDALAWYSPIEPRPVPACDRPEAAILIFPGVLRTTARTEFDGHMTRLRTELGACAVVERVETDTLRTPEINARVAAEVVERLDATFGPLPLHLVGYSQGARNAFQAIVDVPSIHDRTASVLTMNSAAHGSPLADLSLELVDLTQAAHLVSAYPEEACASVRPLIRPLCEWAAERADRPFDYLLRIVAKNMGVPVNAFDDFLRIEGEPEGISVSEFLRSRRSAIESLGPAPAADFWAARRSEVPESVLVTAFRSVITRETRNLPYSNALGYYLLERAGDTVPYNDMAVLLTDQNVPPSLTDQGLALPVAEGNHWQWQYFDGELPADVVQTLRPNDDLDDEARAHMLLGYFRALHEAGLLLGE